MTRKICVITGSRAEYGLLRWVMEGIKRKPELTLQVAVTGMHLAPEFGLTYRDIEADGFRIDRRVEMLVSSDTSSGVAKSMGLGIIGFADAFDELRPDLVVVLGDRFEIFAAVTAAMTARIPIAHLHGGESSEGAIDEAIRHSITKMSHLHFVAAEEYRRRVVQLGEEPDHVFLVGALGVDNILKLPLLDRAKLEAELGCRLGEKSLLVTFHPATLDKQAAQEQMAELLAALRSLKNTTLIFTMPNADQESRALFRMIEEFVAGNSHARAFTSLGQLRYLSCMKHVDAVIGNSSSGLIEAPSLWKATINIGDRQRGRLKAASVVDCVAERGAILEALQKIDSPEYRARLTGLTNPYGRGGASDRIVDVLASQPLEGLLKKRFFAAPAT